MGTLPAPQGLAVRTVAPEIGRGTNRQLTIPSCALDCDSLGRVFALLQTKANEAAELEVAAFRILPGQTQEQLDAQKTQARFLMELIVRIQAANGEWTIANIAAALDGQNLPTTVQDSREFAVLGKVSPSF